ncbi:MAG: tRNA 2-thiouridine(34) synthase MnmA [Candidatus Dormibacteraeota bacterium]|nr:tRNA 2-thiouridine(34) synthase MnmA [Candidatus Dormibacteraeota bacterium]
MSGGVDSSVAAARVCERGLNAFAVTLAMWPGSAERTRDRGCCSVDAVEDARRVAATLGLPHYVWNLEGEFERAVIRPFEDAYAAGVTPNPCTRCNEQIKFGRLLQRVLAAGATHLATGHYARTGRRQDDATLHRSREARRDQSYVLHRLGQDQLRRAVFPVGALETKAALRAEAQARGLATAAKPESQDLCFVETTMASDLEQRLAGRFRPGPILDADGRRIGTHRGLPFYTVGQRSGLGIAPATPDAAPRYVAEIRSTDNTLVVGPREALQRTLIDVAGCSWVGAAPPSATDCVVQLRAHGAPLDAVVIERRDDGARLRLVRPAAQVSPGQAAVLYRDDEVLGGGVITGAA